MTTKADPNIITDGYWVTSKTSIEHLHKWAAKNGIGRHWFHGLREGRPRYKLPYRKLGLARFCKQATAQDVLAYSKAIALVGRKNNGNKKSILDVYRFKIGQDVFARPFVDDGDAEWIHCRVVARTSRKNNKTYTLRLVGGDKTVGDVPEKDIKKVS